MSQPDETVVPYATAMAALELIEEAIEPCDHAVNLCSCSAKGTADDLRRAIGLPTRWFPRDVPSIESELA